MATCCYRTNKVVDIVGSCAVEAALEQPIPAPINTEVACPWSHLVRLLHDYPLLKAKASAAKPQLTLDLTPPPPPPPPPPSK